MQWPCFPNFTMVFLLYEWQDLEKNLELSNGSFQRQLHTEKKKVHEAQEENRVLLEELRQLNQKLKVKITWNWIVTTSGHFYVQEYFKVNLKSVNSALQHECQIFGTPVLFHYYLLLTLSKKKKAMYQVHSQKSLLNQSLGVWVAKLHLCMYAVYMYSVYVSNLCS